MFFIDEPVHRLLDGGQLKELRAVGVALTIQPRGVAIQETYTIALNGSQVKDTAGNAVLADSNLSIVPVPRRGLGTLAVDQHWRLYCDEAALEQMGTEAAAGLILHELDLLLKRHHKRDKQLVGDDAARWDTWNHATDASINGDLRSQNIPLPPGLIYPEKFNLPPGLSAEEYFRSLSSNQAPDEDRPSPDPQDSDDEAPADESDGQTDVAPDSPASEGQAEPETADGTPSAEPDGLCRISWCASLPLLGFRTPGRTACLVFVFLPGGLVVAESHRWSRWSARCFLRFWRSYLRMT